jgi:NDP-sugar pyrophosphorylase family protein
MQGVILAAGRGERLRPITLTRSKAMAPVVGKPITERVMETLVANGVDDIILVVRPDDDEIIHHFQQESEIQATVRFVPQPERLGMAHALQCAAHLINGDFILSACDNLVSEDHVGRILAAYHDVSQPSAVLTLMLVEPAQVTKGGIVAIDGAWVTRIVEKPTPEEAPSNIYSLPLYCFSARILDHLADVQPSPRGEYELQDAIQMLIDRDGRVRGVTIASRLALTNPEDLLAINQHYLAISGDLAPFAPRAVGRYTKLLPPLCIEPGTAIGAHCTIGPNVYVEHDCQIGDWVNIQDAVILRGSTVPDGTTLQEQVIALVDD